MKSTLVRSALTTFALAAFAVGSAHANTITPTLTGFVPGVSVDYTATFSSGELHAGDGFTIYDIGGFTGFLAVHPSWTATANNLASPWGGPPPLTTPDGAATNVHFEYNGPTLQVQFGNIFFAPFTLGTTATLLTTDDWESRDHTLATVPIIGDGVPGDFHQDTISVPFVESVPDGGSTVMLLGSALVAFGMLRRKFNG